MKKIFLIMFSLLLLVACHSTEPWIPPASIVGSFPTNYTLQQAEDVLYDSCLSAKWQVEQIDKTGSMTISFVHKGFNFSSQILFDKNQYKLSYVKINSPQNNKKAEVYYQKAMNKLNLVIRKIIAKRQ